MTYQNRKLQTLRKLYLLNVLTFEELLDLARKSGLTATQLRVYVMHVRHAKNCQ